MKISASLYAQPGTDLESTVRSLDAHRVDYLHLDCRDDNTVFDDVKRVRRISRTPLDLHLISPRPLSYLDRVRELDVELFSVQHESLEGGLVVPDDLLPRFGLALTAASSLDALEPWRDRMRFVLFMATTPGHSGGVFDRGIFRRIRDCQRRFPGLRIHVDGGVDEEVSFILRNMGVYAAVSGSFLLGNQEGEGPLGARMLRLLRGGLSPAASGAGSRFRVRDFMLERDELPLLGPGQTRLPEILQAIEAGQRGFVLLEDPAQRLRGLISNADVRRGLLRHLDDLNRVGLQDVINEYPVVARTEDRIADLLARIQACPFPIGFMPVLDSEDRLAGALQFNQLIKGES
jgi:ribulose-phosphate 3-epimerase